MRIRPVEFVVRDGWVTLKDLARYFGICKSTAYRWTVWRQCFPKGFPKAERIGSQWMVRWSEIELWESGLLTRTEEKAQGVNIGRPGNIDVGALFDYE